MDTKTSESEKKKDKQSADFDILRKDEAFWQRTVKILSKNEISEAKIENAENDNNAKVKHAERVFNINCKCNHCRISRELIVGTFVENCAYNQLWSKLQEIISSYYTFLSPEQESIVNRKYQELLSQSCGIRWFSDGSIDVKKNIHVSMGSYFSISNEMTFMIVFNILYARDRHQLFELLCLQLTSIILAYREGIKEMTRSAESNGDSENYKPEEFLNYIINGYERIMEISETLTPLVIEMREHLQKFQLSWKMMNQCMYYRFLYVDIESRMADCILRLKDVVSPDVYKAHVYRFIKFDEEMTSIGQVWEVALVALELFRKSTPEQINRVDRINKIRHIHQTIRDLELLTMDAGKPLSDQVLALDWIVSSENDDVWHSVINSIRNEQLFKNFRKDCKCWACLISDGNSVPDICAIPPIVSDMKNGSKKRKSTNGNDDCYHLAWAVFKRLSNRQPYNKSFFRPETFCVFNGECERMECQVASNLIIGAYPLSFTKFLLRHYHQPLSAVEREQLLKVPSYSLVRKYCRKKGGAAAKEILHEAEEINQTFLLLNMFWDDDEVCDPVLREGLAAALAENFKIDVKFPQKHTIFSYFYALFRLDPTTKDVNLDLEWLEQINLANIFKSFSSTMHDSSTRSLLNPSKDHHHHPLEMQLNEVKITAEVSAGGNALDLVQFSMKEVADKLNSISLSDDNENAKTRIENEIKKPLVEALKLAASNKKLEAELKSLQKEHNMLKDMVKGLEQIHGEKKEVQLTVTTTSTKSSETQATNTSVSNNGGSNTVQQQQAHSKCGHGHNHCHSHSQSGSSSPSIPEDHGGKDDCVCYYCTLFGKNQDLAANPRSTEARDRLRKKLHHLQSQKDFSNKSKNNLKNISLLLKNGTPPSPKAKSTVGSNNGSISNGGHKCSEHPPGAHSKTNGTSNGPTLTSSMKMKVELELQHRKKKATIVKPNYNTKPEGVVFQQATEINLKSLENLIEYIEGPSSKAVAEQKKAEELAAKKQLKKVKQQQLKVRRQVEQQIESLKETNASLHEIGIHVKQVQNQISQLKSSKGRTKESRRVVAAEEKLSELIGRRTKVENTVRSIVEGIKELSPNINIIDECIDMKSVMNVIAPDYVPPPPPQVIQKTPSPSPAVRVISKSQPQLQSSIKNNESKQQKQQQQPITSLIQVQPKSSEEDPAKRMVTIRRVNLPHAEPQVTVTAKGTTPDMDQLLYTFVNGQLVPASNLPPTAFQNSNGSIQLYMSSNNGQTKTIVDPQSLRQMQQQQVDGSQQQKSGKQGKKGLSKKETVQTDNSIKNSSNAKKQQQQQPEKPVQQQAKDSSKDKEQKKNDKKKDAKKKQPDLPSSKAEANKSVSQKNSNETRKEEKEVPIASTKKRTKKTYIDPEFAANPFKLLDDDEDEEEFTTDSEEERNDDVQTLPDIASLTIKENNPSVDKDEKEGTKKKSQKEEVKGGAKKQQQQQQQQQPSNAKSSEKNAQKKQQPVGNQRTKLVERQDSINSATSSNNSREKDPATKQSKKQKNNNKIEANGSTQYVQQSFQLHPQYQPTVYQPADYMRKPVIASQPSHHQNSHSIMDQLNRGVRVEGLVLPPGITLTRVTPSTDIANNAARRDSINRIAQPMQDYSQQTRMSMDEHMMFSQGRDPNGIIMVESNPHAAQKQQPQQQQQTENSNSKKSKKKKKSKGDGNDALNKLNQQSNGGGGGNSAGDRMVTLKNPMFFAGGNSNNVAANNGSSSACSNNNGNATGNHNSETMMSSMMRNLQTPPFISPMIDSPQQQASIIKNENGMYTIRNPAFQQNVFGSPAPPSSTTAAAYGNGMTNSSPSSYITHSTIVDSNNRPPYMPNSFSCESEQQPKCSSVIGSEMRNFLQRRKEQEYAHMDPYGMRSSAQYSHFGGTGVGFSGSDENFMSRASNYQPYASQSSINNFDDLRLQPGMLNSEVTIHNVTESKFFQNQAQMPIGTPRNLTSAAASSSCTTADATAKLFGGSELLVQSAASSIVGLPHAPMEFNGSESGMCLNQHQGRNSIDIESEERDIEMFKQFDSYVPPKQKMKCNINMNEILVNAATTSSSAAGSSAKKSTVAHAMNDDFERKQQTSSTNSNSPSSLASSSMDELYEKASYYATHAM